MCRSAAAAAWEHSLDPGPRGSRRTRGRTRISGCPGGLPDCTSDTASGAPRAYPAFARKAGEQQKATPHDPPPSLPALGELAGANGQPLTGTAPPMQKYYSFLLPMSTGVQPRQQFRKVVPGHRRAPLSGPTGRGARRGMAKNKDEADNVISLSGFELADCQRSMRRPAFAAARHQLVSRYAGRRWSQRASLSCMAVGTGCVPRCR